MKVVLDTNVLVSALLKQDGVPGRILQAVWNGTLELLSSAPLQEELAGVLEYPKIRKRLETQAVDIKLFLELMPFLTTSVTLVDVSVPRPRDADDRMVLASFVAGQGDWLITGDGDLLALAPSFPIIRPAEFVERFLL